MASTLSRSQSLSAVKRAIDSVASHLVDYLPLANAHMAEFITSDSWQKLLTDNIRSDLLSLTDAELICLPSGHLYKEHLTKSNISQYQSNVMEMDTHGFNKKKSGSSQPQAQSHNDNVDVHSAKKDDFVICGDRSNVLRGKRVKWDPEVVCSWQHNSLKDFMLACLSNSLPHCGVLQSVDNVPGLSGPAKLVPIVEFMSAKKSHEVEIMADICGRYSKEHEISCAIEIGSGKGYLGSHLNLKHNMRVLGIDSSTTNTAGAEGRAQRLGKQWNGLVTRSEQQNSQSIAQRASRHKTKRRAPSKSLDIDKDDKSLNDVELTTDRMLSESRNETTSEGDQRLSMEDATVNMVEQSKDVPEAKQNVMLDTFDSTLATKIDAYDTDLSSINELDTKNCRKSEKGFFVPVTMFVDKSTDLSQLVSQYLDKHPSSNSEETADTSGFISSGGTDDSCPNVIEDLRNGTPFLISGLHACGDLTSNLLRLFVNNKDARLLCSVGCCYHHLTEAFISCPFGKDCDILPLESGFPISVYLQSKGCQLGRNAKMLASQAPDRIAQAGNLPSVSLYWRALLQVILRDLTGEVRKDWNVGRIAAKCPDFFTYTMKALAKLGIQHELTSKDIHRYECQYEGYQFLVQRFVQLKASLAPCVEALIQLDRLCYLMEQDHISQAHLIQAFDPLTSPRCYALLASKHDQLNS